MGANLHGLAEQPADPTHFIDAMNVREKYKIREPDNVWGRYGFAVSISCLTPFILH